MLKWQGAKREENQTKIRSRGNSGGTDTKIQPGAQSNKTLFTYST